MIPPGVIEIRQSLCQKCARKAHDPCASCKHGHWGRYEQTGCEKSGRGKRIARVAKPIARGLDAVLGTQISKCGGCKQMEQDLDAGLPIVQAIKKRLRRRKAVK